MDLGRIQLSRLCPSAALCWEFSSFECQNENRAGICEFSGNDPFGLLGSLTSVCILPGSTHTKITKRFIKNFAGT